MKYYVAAFFSALCVNLILIGVEIAADIEIELVARMLIVVPIAILIDSLILKGWEGK